MVFSIVTLAVRINSDDASLFKDSAKHLDFQFKKCKSCMCWNWFYLQRFIFMCCDVSGRIFLLSLCWVAVNGYLVTLVLCIDFIVIAICMYRLNGRYFYFAKKKSFVLCLKSQKKSNFKPKKKISETHKQTLKNPKKKKK